MEPNLENYVRMIPRTVWNMVGEMPFILFILALPFAWWYTGSFYEAIPYAMFAVVPGLAYTLWNLFPEHICCGVRWDRRGKPRCPFCKTRLVAAPTAVVKTSIEEHPTKTNWVTGAPSKVVKKERHYKITTLKCPGCKMVHQLHDEKGRPVELADAKRLAAETRL